MAGVIDFLRSNLVILVLGTGICLCAGAIGLIVWRSGQKPKTPFKRIAIDEISEVWLKNKEVPIKELAPVWRDEKVEIVIEKDFPEFQNVRIQEFYNLHVEKIPDLHREVCRELLSLLDREGDCSSVVNVSTDIEASWNSCTYTLLGQTNLLDHSLNVAEEAVRLLMDSEAGYIVPDALIVALAHDIGKVPSIRTYLYSLGEHPLTAGRVLTEIVAFGQLADKDMLLRAIKLHHKKPDNLLGKTLKTADQIARQKEIEQAQERLPPLENPVKNGEKPMDFLAQEETVKKKHNAPILLNISGWFDAKAMIEEIKPFINEMQGRRFSAFSLAKGYVFVHPKIIEDIARKQAEQAGVLDVVTMEGKEMQNVLCSIVHHLRQEDVIADGLLKENYFGGYFTVTMKTGVTMEGYYTPCHAEPFGSIAEMEQRKTAVLLDIVSVEPLHKVSEEEAWPI